MRGQTERCAQLREELINMTHDEEKQIRCWAAIEWAEIQELRGNIASALETLSDEDTLLEEGGNTERIWLLGLQSRLLLLNGQPEPAR